MRIALHCELAMLKYTPSANLKRNMVENEMFLQHTFTENITEK
jgi:hypothetical protein